MNETAHKINVLDEVTASKIAAGEVVEKPAMVVKELLENSIDAKATQITLEIQKGGKAYIRVTDNGTGIGKDDLERAFLRHATSKIKTIDDLYNSHSLGFRGEALASICAVSWVSLTTKTKTSDGAYKVEAIGGKVKSIEEVGGLEGTTIIVKNLFFNTPARLKFLKTDRSELGYINEVINNIALSHPEIAFHYIVDGKQVYNTPGKGDLKQTIMSVFDKTVAKNIVKIDGNLEGIKVSGYASNIQLFKGTSKQILTFVNGRYVKNDLIKESINLAYKGMIPIGKYPHTYVFIQVAPSEIDVNIHPAKTQIKFHKEGMVKQVVYTAIKKALSVYNQTPQVSFSEKEVFTYKNKEIQEQQAQSLSKTQNESNLSKMQNVQTDSKRHQLKVDSKKVPSQKTIRTKSESDYHQLSFDSTKKEVQNNHQVNNSTTYHKLNVESKHKEQKFDKIESNTTYHKLKVEPNDHKNRQKGEIIKDSEYHKLNVETNHDKKKAVANKNSDYHKLNVDHKLSKVSNVSNTKAEKVMPKKTIDDLISIKNVSKVMESMSSYADETAWNNQIVKEGSLYDDLKYVGQLFLTYLIFQRGNKMIMIDQHAAHEKILYENFMAQYSSEKLVSQMLLLPMTMHVQSTQLLSFDDYKKVFLKWGFEVEVFGEDQIVIRAIPNLFNEKVAREVVEAIMDNKTDMLDEKHIEKIIQSSCKHAIKANDALSEKEVYYLIEDLKKLESPYTCPHGRPIIIEIDKKELEKKFKRVL